MQGIYTEADYENSVIELFRNDLGYEYAYGPDIERDFNSPLYEEELDAAMRRLNPTMPEDAIADALYKLKNFETGSIVQKNTVFMDYLQNGVPVKSFAKDEENPRGALGLCAGRAGAGLGFPDGRHGVQRTMKQSAVFSTWRRPRNRASSDWSRLRARVTPGNQRLA